MRANDPFAQVGKVQVAVDVPSVIRASPDSFRVAWTGRRYQDGSLAATERWSAILTVVFLSPRTPDALRKNPLGVFVTFAWLGRCRRLAKDFENTIESAEAWILVANLRFPTRCLARYRYPS